MREECKTLRGALVTRRKIVSNPAVWRRMVLTAAVAGMLAGPARAAEPAHPQAPRPVPLVSTTIDFLDYCFYRTQPDVGYFTEAQYEDVIKSVAAAGIGKIYIRVNVCGLTLYPTQVGKQFAGDGRDPGSTYLANTLKKYDPLQKTIELGRKYGLSVWAWENLFDDEATVFSYPPVKGNAKYETYGEYPLKDPFLIANPHLQWALDPRLKTDPATAAATQTAAGPITKIRLISEEKKAPRVTRELLDVYVSTDNRTFTRYPTDDVTVTIQPSAPGPVVILENLRITEPYLKIAFKQEWPQDGTYTIAGMPATLTEVFFDDAWRPAFCSFSEGTDPGTGGVDFASMSRFALDYGTRALVVAKCTPPLPPSYGMIELSCPEAKAHKLAKLRELAAYPFDGFAYSLRTHSRVSAPAKYGFNDIVRDEFLKRYGKDIWRDDFDRDAWFALRAEAVNEYLKLASAAVAPRPLYMDCPAPNTGYARMYGGMPFQAEQWLKDGAVAGVRLLGFPPGQYPQLGQPGAPKVRLVKFVDNGAYFLPQDRREEAVRTFTADFPGWLADPQLDEIEFYETQMYTDNPRYLEIIKTTLAEVRRTRTKGEEAMSTAPEPKVTTLPELREARRKRAWRPRRIIFNNDGNEPVYLCDAATPEALLACRTTGLLGSQVDSIFYCTWSSGFGVFTHNTKVGEVFTSTANPTHPDNKRGGLSKNKTAEFIQQGTDPLRIMVDFCKAHRIEAFWSFRMNDTHDAWGSWYGSLLFPQLKKDHPEWLVSPLKPGAKPGSTDVKDYDRAKHGGWTAMDFNHQEVRDLAVRFIEEVCENYDVDGIEMDFLRHAVYFKGPAWGTDATTDELAKLTDMVRQVRDVTERIGMQRGRPILVAVRVPDSVEYAKAMGIDIERWLTDGLVDTMAVSDYFRLNPWTVSTELGHKYGVPVYACLSETRLKDTDAARLRSAPPCYRGRTAVAWAEGVDGIYMFNAFDPRSPLWRELGDANALRAMDKTFVVAARGAQVTNFWMADGEKRFQKRAYLTPERPLPLEPGKAASIELRAAGMPEASADPARPVSATLRLRVDGGAAAENLVVTLNSTPLTGATATAPWLDYPVALNLVKDGPNLIEVTLNPGPIAKARWLDVALQVKAPAGGPLPGRR